MENFKDAPGVRKLAKSIIKKVETHAPITELPIEYLYTDKRIKEGKTEVPCKVLLIKNEAAYLATRHSGLQPVLCVIKVDKETWDLCTPELKEAYLDRALTKIHYDEEALTIELREYDIQEFDEIITRHGAFNTDLQSFFKAARNPQLGLFPEASEGALNIKLGTPINENSGKKSTKSTAVDSSPEAPKRKREKPAEPIAEYREA